MASVINYGKCNLWQGQYMASVSYGKCIMTNYGKSIYGKNVMANETEPIERQRYQCIYLLNAI